MEGGVVLATAGYDHTIRFWTPSQGVCYRTLQHADSQVNAMSITPDKQFLAAAGNPNIRLFEIETQNPNAVTSYDGHTSNVTALGFQAAGKWMYSSSEDGTAKIWDLRASEHQRNFAHGEPVSCCKLHPNEVELITGDHKGVLRVVDLRTTKVVKEITTERESALYSIDIASTGKFMVAGNSKGKVALWHLEEGRNGNDGPALSMVDTAMPNILDMKLRSRTIAHDGYVLSVKISPDTQLIATASSDQGQLKIWNADTMSHVSTLSGHQKWVWDCAFSSDSLYIVSVSSDMTAQLWDISQGASVRTFNGHQKAITCLALQD